MPVPDDVDDEGRWSLDHLFLDQDGVPTLVECKRATDSRIRREVVAQMLDYAANGVEYWGVDGLRQSATETCDRLGKRIDDEIRKLVQRDEPNTSDEYWKAVAENLQHGRIRLLFVADETPKELRRLVQFLNEKMAPDVQVLAIEVKQYLASAGGGVKALVSRVVGQVESLKNRGSVKSPTQDPQGFMSTCTSEAREFYEPLLRKATEVGHQPEWHVTGFSLCAPLKDGGVVKYARGKPAYFRLRTDRLAQAVGMATDDVSVLMGEFMRLGPFVPFEEGQGVGQTLRLALDKPTTGQTLVGIIDPLLNRVQTLLQSQRHTGG